MKPPPPPIPALPKSPFPHPPLPRIERRRAVPAAPRPVVGICPECAAPVTLAEILAAALTRNVIMCPRCEIGTAPREWHAAP